MEQHPVPQHIASFEFKLFGNLTVRQFVTLAIPMSGALAIFFSGLPSFIRIPTSGLIALFALFASLVPIGGRPFDKWVVSFVHAVLSPTQRIWVKEPGIPSFLKIVVAPPAANQQIPESITAQGRERLKNYLRALPRGEVSPLDVREQIAIQRLDLESLAAGAGGDSGKLPPPILWPTSGTKPFMGATSLPQVESSIAVSMAQTAPGDEYESGMDASLPVVEPYHQKATTIINSHAKAYVLPGLDKKLRSGGEEVVAIAPTIKAQLATETIENIIPIQTPGKPLRLIHGVGKTRARKLHFAPPEGFDLSKLPIRGERRFEISEELKKRFSDTSGLFDEPKAPPAPKVPEIKRAEAVLPYERPKIEAEKDYVDADLSFAAAKGPSSPKAVHFVPKAKVSTATSADVKFKTEEKEILDSQISARGQKSQTVPLPQSGTSQMMPLTNVPNVLSGSVIGQDGMPLEKAIIIVKEMNGIPVRALKTNKLGQFLSATPLANGEYTMDIESDLFHFSPMKISVVGEVLQPFEIRAQVANG